MTTHPRNYPDDQIEHPDRGSALDPDHYDDFIASDVLHALIRAPHSYVAITKANMPDDSVLAILTIDGSVGLTPEQAAVLRPLIPVFRGGTLQPATVPDMDTPLEHKTTSGQIHLQVSPLPPFEPEPESDEPVSPPTSEG
jgi:hypothetical protein